MAATDMIRTISTSTINDVYSGTKDENSKERGDGCGHYLNIIDAGAKAIGIATGSGKNTDSEVTIFDYSAEDTEQKLTSLSPSSRSSSPTTSIPLTMQAARMSRRSS